MGLYAVLYAQDVLSYGKLVVYIERKGAGCVP